MKKKWLYLFGAALMSITIMACSDDEKENTNSNSQPVGKVLILNEMSVTLEEALDEAYGDDIYSSNGSETPDVLAQAQQEAREQTLRELTGAKGSKASEPTFVKLTIQYPTVGAKGEVMLSGTIVLAMRDDELIEPNDIFLSCHPTSMNSNMAEAQNTFTNRAADNLMVLLPDYEGLGINHDPQTYLCQKLIGRQCADMIPAAIQVLKEKYNYEMPEGYGTYIVGYSQGGGNAMATARYLQEEAPASLRQMANVKKLCCGGGPYDPMATFQHWLTKDTCSMSMVLPMVVRGFFAGHSDIMGQLTQDNFLTYFSEIYKPYALNVFNGNMRALSADGTDGLASIRWSNSMLGLMQYPMKFSGIMSEACADPNSDIRKRMEQCLRYEIVNDWVPSHPVALYQSTSDPVIPYNPNTQSTYDKFQAAGVDVTLAKLEGLDHLVAQLMWSIRINTMKEYRNRIQ